MRFFAPPVVALGVAMLLVARLDFGRLRTHLTCLGAALGGAVWMSALTRLQANSGFVGEGAFISGAMLALVAVWWTTGALISSFLFAICGNEPRHVIWIHVVSWPSPLIASWMIDWWLSVR